MSDSSNLWENFPFSAMFMLSNICNYQVVWYRITGGHVKH